MRRAIICSGVLGGGTALVFALAALTASVFPHGTVVQSQWGTWGGPMFVEEGRPMPAVGMPLFADPDVFVDEGKP